MKIKIDRVSLNLTVLFLLAFFTLLFPRDNFHIKKILLLFFLLYNFGTIINCYKKDALAFLITCFIPFALVIQSVIQNGDLYFSLTQVYFYGYFAIAYVVYKNKFDIKKMLLLIGNIMVILILVCAILDFTQVLPYDSNPVLKFFSSNGEAQISVSVYAIAYYVFFFKASPILLFNLLDCLQHHKYFQSALIFTSILFTGTRANIFMGVFVVGVYVAFIEKNRMIQIVFGMVLLLLLIRFGVEIIDRVSMVNVVKSGGDDIRVETVKGIIDSFKSDPMQLFTGAGFGSQYYNSSLHRLGLQRGSEMSYFEIFRQTGLIYGSLIVLFLIAPLRRIFYCSKSLFWFYIAYLTEGFFEPFIFTSTGFFIVAVIYSEVYIAYDMPMMYAHIRNRGSTLSNGNLSNFDNRTGHYEYESTYYH